MTEELNVQQQPPADRRCQIYISDGTFEQGLSRCSEEGTHWERWVGCGCPDVDSELCEDDFSSWECDGAHNTSEEPA